MEYLYTNQSAEIFLKFFDGFLFSIAPIGGQEIFEKLYDLMNKLIKKFELVRITTDLEIVFPETWNKKSFIVKLDGLLLIRGEEEIDLFPMYEIDFNKEIAIPEVSINLDFEEMLQDMQELL